MRASYTFSFEHSFDRKGRITVPTEWRTEQHEKILYAFPGRNCLRVYPSAWLGELQTQIAALDMEDPKRQALEWVASEAQTLQWDEQGRVLVKEKLRAAFGLTREAVLAGKLDHFEIWEPAAWQAQRPAQHVTVEDATRFLRT